MSNPKISIIILNWNGWEDTINCLESLFRIHYDNFDVVVVDNYSTDVSIKKIRSYVKGDLKANSPVFESITYCKPNSMIEFFEGDIASGNFSNLIKNLSPDLILIKNSKNHGFAKGNNIAIKFILENIKTDYILLLNNDTIVHPNFLQELVEVFRTEKDVVIAGPKIFPYIKGVVKNEKGIIGYKIRFWRGATPNGIIKTFNTDVDMVSGACMLVDCKIFQKFGLLDSVFFFGWEDADFCTKIKRKGYRIIGVPKSKILHKIGASYGDHFANNPDILREGIRNQLIFLFRYADNIQKISSIPFLFLQFIFLIFWKSNGLKKIKIKTIFIGKGIEDFIIYKKL